MALKQLNCSFRELGGGSVAVFKGSRIVCTVTSGASWKMTYEALVRSLQTPNKKKSAIKRRPGKKNGVVMVEGRLQIVLENYILVVCHSKERILVLERGDALGLANMLREWMPHDAAEPEAVEPAAVEPAAAEPAAVEPAAVEPAAAEPAAVEPAAVEPEEVPDTWDA